ncbi:hypothetical protein Sulac_0571 [Sulfobacillus acidophilus DSM 10332]|uniref:Uncharacterized protein n=1 Tax=Sulfobacillus acidophilus (strain ATCC 700253 / DSM 10332 / NAL) TaxID=679936 RepID=G8TZD3_SULAD|nr:hypothetical protein Sulac_0571 [Sulfobacillus acidophilus DSM 10332]
MRSRWLWVTVAVTLGGIGITLWQIQTAHPTVNPLTPRILVILFSLALSVLIPPLIPFGRSGRGKAVAVGLLILAWLGWMFFFNEAAWLGPGLISSTLWIGRRTG